MSWPFKDYDFYGNRYVNIEDPTATLGERMWYDRNTENTPTECILCIEAENEMYSKYAHPRAHLEAHTEAANIATRMATKEKDTDEYIEYYTFYYGREYKKIYKKLYAQYKQEYSAIVLKRQYNKTDKICQHHLECIQYHYELS